MPAKTLEAEIAERQLAFLKKAYYNARTDVVAEQTGVAPNRKHVLPVLNNLADEAAQSILQLIRKRLPEPYGTENVDFEEGFYACLELINALLGGEK